MECSWSRPRERRRYPTEFCIRSCSTRIWGVALTVTNTEYVRPKRRPSIEPPQRITIARMLIAMAVFAAACACLLIVRGSHSGVANWLFLSLTCGALGVPFRGHEGFWSGAAMGAIVIPALLIAFWMVSMMLYFLYMGITGQHIGGLGS